MTWCPHLERVLDNVVGDRLSAATKLLLAKLVLGNVLCTRCIGVVNIDLLLHDYGNSTNVFT